MRVNRNERILLGFLLLTLMSVFSTMVVYSGTITLPKTGQIDCWDASGNSISCGGTGQDGETQTGAAWPTMRFTWGTNTMTDNLTGLMWAKNGSTPAIADGGADCSSAGIRTWLNAMKYVDCMNTASAYGYTDWRMPNLVELNTLVNAQHYSGGVYSWLTTATGWTSIKLGSSDYYWANTTYANQPAKAWVIYLREQKLNEISNSGTPKSLSKYVLPVRGGTQ